MKSFIVIASLLCVACIDLDENVVKPQSEPAPRPGLQLKLTGKSTCLEHWSYFEVERPNDYPVWLRLFRNGKPVPC